MDFNPQLQLAGLLEWMDAQLKACHGRTAVIDRAGTCRYTNDVASQTISLTITKD